MLHHLRSAAGTGNHSLGIGQGGVDDGGVGGVAAGDDSPQALRIDAEYKDYWKAMADGSPVRRISNDDLYQLFFYTQRIQLRHQLSQPPDAYIICPLPEETERVDPVISDRFTNVKWQSGAEVPSKLNLLLLPLGEILQRLSAGGHPMLPRIIVEMQDETPHALSQLGMK